MSRVGEGTDCSVRRDGMQSGMLISMLIIITTAAIMLAIQAVSLIIQLRRRTASNKELIDYSARLMNDAEEGRRAAAEAERRAQECRSACLSLLNSIPEIVLMHAVDADGNPGPLVEVNDAACTQLGIDRATMADVKITDIIGVDVSGTADMSSQGGASEHVQKAVRKAVRNSIQAAMNGEPFVYEGVLRGTGGKLLQREMTVIRTDVSGVAGVAWIARDMTDIRAGQRAVKESQQRMEDFFSHSPLGIAIFDADRRLITSNRAVYRMFGMPDAHEFENLNLFKSRFLPPDARETLSRGDAIHIEIVVDFKDVRERGLFVSHRRDKGHFDVVVCNMGLDKQYRPRGYFAQIADVTQRHKTEAELMRLQTAEQSKDGVSGSIEDMAFTDIMQVMCAGGRNMQMSLSDRNREGVVFIQGGAVVHCKAADKTGEEAFYELMRWNRGKFTAGPCEKFPDKTIGVSLMSLMMEGARRLDETAPAEEA